MSLEGIADFRQVRYSQFSGENALLKLLRKLSAFLLILSLFADLKTSTRQRKRAVKLKKRSLGGDCSIIQGTDCSMLLFHPTFAYYLSA